MTDKQNDTTTGDKAFDAMLAATRDELKVFEDSADKPAPAPTLSPAAQSILNAFAPKRLREMSSAAVAEPVTISKPAERVSTSGSGISPTLPSGGLRERGKLPYDLIPAEFNLLLGAILEYGAKKYAPHNFERGLDPDDLLRGAEGHLLAMKAGDLYDPESGLPHAGHAAWNMLTFAMQMMREPAMEEVFTRVITKRRAGNLTAVCREYADKHELHPDWEAPELAPTPWHERVAMLRNCMK